MDNVTIQVVLDTNFLVVPGEFGVDIFQEAERVLERRIEFVLLEPVLREIELRVSRPRTRIEGRRFSIALKLAERCRVVKVDRPSTNKTVDDQLLDYAVSVRGVLATNDRELKQKAKSQGVPVLMLRGKKKLQLDGTVV